MITESAIGGVPVLLAPAAGPMRAGLVFRVGEVDETLARHGITHLVEHLALHRTGVADYHYNGVTGAEYTSFHIRGSAAEVTAFLTGVCAALRDLPMHRMATEKEILRTEASTRGPAEPLALWRHGARGHGLSSYPEWGLHAITPDDLTAWVFRYFTRQNAVLWVAGDAVPADLVLDLPDGERRPAPAAPMVLPVTPASFPGSSPSVLWDTVLPREPAAEIFAGLLQRRMFRELRQEGGLSYLVQATYEPRSDGTATITAGADALPEKQAAVLGGFVDMLAGLRAGRIESDEVASVIELTCQAAQDTAEQLLGQARDLLAGRRPIPAADQITIFRTVTVADVAAVAVAAYDAGLLMTPPGTDGRWAGYVPAPTTSPTTVTGTAYPGPLGSGYRLIAGPDGVSSIHGDEVATVRYDACAALLAWPDGARQLIGDDGIVVRIEPTLIRGADTGVDAEVPPGLRIDLPARDPARIPRARDHRSRRFAPQFYARAAGALWGPMVITVMFAAIAVAFLPLMRTDPIPAIVVVAVFGLVAFRSGRRAWRLARQLLGG